MIFSIITNVYILNTLIKWLSGLQFTYNPFARHYSPSERRMFSFLRQNILLRTLTDEELVVLIPHIYERVYQKNEVIFFRNDPSQAFYIIRTGRVMLTLDTGDRFEKLITLSRYNYFGENALMNETSRAYNAISVSEKTEIYAIPQVHLTEIFEDEPQIRAKITEALATVYERQLGNIFRAYSESFGFFDLGRVCFGTFHKTSTEDEL